MTIDLDRLERADALRQSQDVSQLVAGQQEWLEKFYPRTIQQYHDLGLAFGSINTLKYDYELAVFVARRNKIAVGLALVTCNQTIIHPDIGAIEGNFLDYWLEPNSTEADHTSTAYALLVENDEFRQPKHESAELPVHVFSTIATGQINPPIGVTKIMTPIGQPAVINVADESDPYNISKQGAEVQLYGYKLSPEPAEA